MINKKELHDLIDNVDLDKLFKDESSSWYGNSYEVLLSILNYYQKYNPKTLEDKLLDYGLVCDKSVKWFILYHNEKIEIWISPDKDYCSLELKDINCKMVCGKENHDIIFKNIKYLESL